MVFTKRLAFTLALAFLCGFVARGSDADAPRPNIIFILVDDMGWGDVGCFYQNSRKGLPAMTTPQLDRMAAEGLQLRRHYSGSPVCAPSRASLFSGVHQGNARVVRDNTFDMPLENSHTLATVLKQAGYATALIGKWGIGGGRESGGGPQESTAYPTRRGFDYFFGYLDHIAAHRHYPATDPADKRAPGGKNRIWDQDRIVTDDCTKAYSTDLLTARAKKWIADQRKESPDKPFFLALTYVAPHAALQVPTQAYPQGGGLKGGLQWLGEPGRIINTASGEIDSYIEPEYAARDWPVPAKRHATMIRRIDDSVGDIMQLLKDLKIDDNTLVVFSSDNGPHNEGSFTGIVQDPRFFRSYGPFDGIKRDTWEGGLRVPAIVRWPAAVPANRLSQQPSQFHDWMATFAEVAGVPVPARSDGVSLVPTLTGRGRQEPGIVYAEYNYNGKSPAYKDFKEPHRGSARQQQQVVHVGPYKGVRRAVKSADDDFEIYDTEKDPQEAVNLARKGGEFDAIQQAMKEKVLQLRRVYDYHNRTRGNLAKRPYDKALVPSVDVSRTSAGLKFRLFSRDAAPWVPKFASSSTGRAVVTKGIVAPDGLAGPFTGEWSGYIDIPRDGEYTFYVRTDGNQGSRAFVRLHDMALVDADFTYTPGEEVDSSAAVGTSEAVAERTGRTPVRLKAGRHPIRIGYVHGAGEAGPELEFSWKGPDIAKQPVPANALSY